MVAMDEKRQSKPSPSSSSSSPGRAEGGGERSGKREDEEVPQEKTKTTKVVKSYPTFLGRHRMSAAISHLNNQINIIEVELNELETVGQSSIVCKELVSSLETIPDPLLPTTEGPADDSWDRWFRGAHNSRGHKRWI
ncbi:G-protein gamma-like domain containing protein [Parasponia andersonii]|uniref:G-protein gamma-like domain containing protein n=1 Tax=Parasponia andersonii TaxID=3476 RepID=A0A2P5DI57_PARAD|nr:G-protein gamma-like domain containing protein [Parasponia andersonii]